MYSVFSLLQEKKVKNAEKEEKDLYVYPRCQPWSLPFVPRGTDVLK